MLLILLRMDMMSYHVDWEKVLFKWT